MHDDMEEVMQKALSAAIDIAAAELDCHHSDMDYAERRAYCRHLLIEYLKEQEAR